MKFYQRHIKFLFFLIAILQISSCKKFVEVDAPNTQLVTEVVFTSDEMIESAISGIYSKMLDGESFASGGVTGISVLSGLSADEFIGYPSFSDYVPFFTNSLLASDPRVKETWELGYKYIYYTNAVLEGLKASSGGISETKAKQIEGEALFIRAFCHFYLVNLFGPVPVVTTTDYRVNNFKLRDDSSVVYMQIINDLLKAKELLPLDFSHLFDERVRPIQSTASALLARVYLFTHQWEKAEQEASLLITNTALFNLPNDLNGVFLKNSSEAIWQLKPKTTKYTADGLNMQSAINFSLSDDLVNSFENGDNRVNTWIGVKEVSGNPRYFSSKYKADITSSSLTEYAMMFRLAEQYLIRAEAKVQNNNFSGAREDLNVIHQRAGLPEIELYSKEELLNAIFQERRVELFAESGHRWMDLKRSSMADQVLSPVKGGNWSSDDQLYPIPITEISNNKNLTQNKSY